MEEYATRSRRKKRAVREGYTDAERYRLRVIGSFADFGIFHDQSHVLNRARHEVIVEGRRPSSPDLIVLQSSAFR
jgi:hypothetical protein